MSLLKRLLFLLLPVYGFGQTVIKPGGAVTISCSTCPACPGPVIIHDTVKTNTTLIIHDTVKINQTIIIHDSVCPTVPPVVVTPPPNTGYTITYSNGYDKDADLDHTHLQLGKGIVSTTTFKTAPGSFKGTVSLGDKAISAGFRSENQYMDASQNPKEGAVSYDWLLESINPVSWGGDIAQWHPGGSDNGGSALFFMEAAQGLFNMYCWKKGYYTSYGNPDKIEIGRWYHIRYEFLWSLKADGYWRVYIDGNLYWSYSGPTQISSDQPYLKIGWNFFSGSSNQSTSVHSGTAYWDNLTIEKKN